MRSTGAAALLKETTSQKSCPSCVVITCSDWIRRERATRYILDHFAGEAYRPQSFAFGESGRNSFAHFMNDVAAPSLFEPQKFVVIRALESARASDLEPLSLLMAKKPQGVHVIATGTSLPNSPNFKKAVDKHASLISFEPLKGAELRRWTEREIRHHDISAVSDDIVETILSLASEEPEAVSQLIQKLSLYLSGEAPTIEILRTLVPGRTHASDFELAEQLFAEKRDRTEILLHELLSQGSSPFMLLGLLTKTVTNLLRLRILLDRGCKQQDIRNELGVSPWLFTKYLASVKNLSAARLSKTLEALLKADFRLKDRSLGPGAILSTLAYEASKHG